MFLPKTKLKLKTIMVYCIPCAGCDINVYMGETRRTIGERLKELTAKVANNLPAIILHIKRRNVIQMWKTLKSCAEKITSTSKVRETISGYSSRKRPAPP